MGEIKKGIAKRSTDYEWYIEQKEMEDKEWQSIDQ